MYSFSRAAVAKVAASSLDGDFAPAAEKKGMKMKFRELRLGERFILKGRVYVKISEGMALNYGARVKIDSSSVVKKCRR